MPTFSVNNYKGLDPTVQRTTFEATPPDAKKQEAVETPYRIETSKSVSEYVALQLYQKFLKEKAEEQSFSKEPTTTETIGIIAKEDINNHPADAKRILSLCREVIVIVKDGAFTTAAECQFFDLSELRQVKVFPSISLFIDYRKKHAG